MSIAKRAYRHLQNHPYFLIFTLSFYLVYFSLTFAIALLAKQFSDSSIQLNRIIVSLDAQQSSLNSQPFKILEAIATQYNAKYNSILLIIGIAGTLILLTIQLWLSQTRKQEYQTYLLMGERVYKLTAQLIFEQLLLINSILLLILVSYSIFTAPVMDQITKIEAAALQSELEVNLEPLLSDSQAAAPPDFGNEGFTRFTIAPFLKGAFANNNFYQNNTLQAFLIISIINLYSAIVIGIPNAIILSLRRSNLF
ncbi:hypothetical protein SAMN05878443_2026 [Carnobacterium alterfunditum]|uniref:FtsX-like permease family protein n=1 Tax=Carnobacterium alterfunditum TaxID=28230 RepID=A0A1N6HRA9_9LACT|nr:hypothetical protein [Carnobacterium alterfunditum]SIO22291.1 hypothetical protein SAMN05878443_2026 [Carnobacterium alterfunditum]